MANNIEMRSLGALNNCTFCIPFLQRGYKWTTENVEKLLDDLYQFIQSDKKVYCMQPLALIEHEDDKAKHTVIDGQQRLTTLFLLKEYLDIKDKYTLSFERDEDGSMDNGENRQAFLENIKAVDSEQKSEASSDLYHIWNAYKTIGEWFGKNDCKNDFITLLNEENGQSIQFIWFVIPKESQNTVFRNLNSNKIPLNNTELIKALFLNNVSGLKKETLPAVAYSFEDMEMLLQDDHFWHILSTEDVPKGQNRLDLVFNLVAGVSWENYIKYPNSSFDWFENRMKGSFEEKWEQARNAMQACTMALVSGDESMESLRSEIEEYEDEMQRHRLEGMWKQVRDTFLRLRDMASDIEKYHYIGLLTYCKRRNISERLEDYGKMTKTEFKEALKKEIRCQVLDNNHQSIDDFSYETDGATLRKLFILHNIETILQRYKSLKENENLQLQHEYEWFPFELL